MSAPKGSRKFAVSIEVETIDDDDVTPGLVEESIKEALETLDLFFTGARLTGLVSLGRP